MKRYFFISMIFCLAAFRPAVGAATEWTGDHNFLGDVNVGVSNNNNNNNNNNNSALWVRGRNDGSQMFRVLNGGTNAYLLSVTNGGVAIGKPTPSYLFDVNGNMGVSGNITSTGNIVTTGEIEAKGPASIYNIYRRDNNTRTWGIYSWDGNFSIYDYPTAALGAPWIYTSANPFTMRPKAQIALGMGISVAVDGQTAVGRFNNTNSNDNTTTPATNHQLGAFVVGAGTNDTSRKNAIRVLDDGTVLVQPSTDILMGTFNDGPTP